jgi:hypothetical protein
MLAALIIAGTLGSCSPQDGPGLRWAPEVRAEARARARAVWVAQGVSKDALAYIDAVGERESDYRPGVWHDGGRGLGMHGLNMRSHRDKWPGDDEFPSFCQPEVSALVALEIAHRAYRRYGARDWVAVQSIYGGRWRCYVVPDERGRPRRRCWASRTKDPGTCHRMAVRGGDCRRVIRRKDLGRRTPTAQLRERARELAAAFEQG